MRVALLGASLAVHVLVVVVAPRGSVVDPDDEEESPELTPIELLDPVEITRVPPSPPPEPELEPLPEPEPEPPSEPEPTPEPEPLPPPPPRPPSPPRAARATAPAPVAPTAPATVGATDAPADTDASANDGSDTGPSAPRRLGMTFSNRGQPAGTSTGNEKRTAPAPSPTCKGPKTKPRPTHKVPVEYTRAARAAGIEGRLILQATVGRDGTVTRVKVLRSLGAPVDDPAKTALGAWRFEPATACGEPVVGTFTIARDFSLGD